MSDETLDFLKNWTTKHDERIERMEHDLRSLTVEVVSIGQQLAGLANAFYRAGRRY
jgi:hypothetical protein